ncbi:ribonuclease E inhibitor RraB [Pelagibius litoralis]|uniref:Ribonuclease E inhibitor RraB n=1 Tax=Pelagibius litoralis TaxID=374515 RepID=A0A967EYQ4_9PROT|nr:ribonuclease E inhibitor RraB [Pelagibius litoralis]NIA69859.1 ribonuclease E inhibitor RraB [Pelagibius litoralis]
MDHDWDRQFQETERAYNDLRRKAVDFEPSYKLDLQFFPGTASPDRDGFAAALRKAGYEVSFYRDDSTVEATTAPLLLTVDSIWAHERKATKIALRHGFKPDGWGFMEA